MPDTIAAVYQGQQLSYGELNRRANQLGHYLKKQGVATEELVGVFVDRSLEFLIAVLGILKAGAAYLPLDRECPVERLSYMLVDARVRFLVSNTETPKELVTDGRSVVHLLENWDKIAHENEESPEHNAFPGHLIYAMYTSGSTGQPQPVGIMHRSVQRLVENCNYADLGKEQVMLQFAPTSFDAATFELWGSLLNGGRLAIAPKGIRLDALSQVLQQEGVTTLWLTAGLFHEMVDHQMAGLRSVNQLLAGGDVLSVEHARRFLKNYPGSHLINGYGPTECTTFSCCYRTDNLEGAESVPIGWPINETEVYVLDEQQRPVEANVAGELYIGGEGLARGYLGRPNQTAEKFVPNPFCSGMGERLYRSGDLARWRSDGAIEFLGRVDTQVKIRGYRIEPGEIESALRQHPKVRDTIVSVREQSPGAKRLVAYVVSDEQSTAWRELWSYLAQKLPAHMLPSQFVFLDRLPLTARGKVDREALPPPQMEDADRPPQTHAEAIVASLCAKILSPTPISLDATFLELGGSSLNAIRLMSGTQELAGLNLSLEGLLGTKTLSEVAQEAEQSKIVQKQEGLGRISAGDGPVPASFSQERVWFIDQMAPLNIAYHSIGRITFSGNLDVQALAKALAKIVERHEIYRTTLREADGELFQIVHAPWPVELELIELERTPELADKIFKLKVQEPFDLTRLPLVRWTLLRLNQHKHVLLVVENHVVHDGWSFNIVLKEITELYRAFVEGWVPQINPAPPQFAAYSVWQRRWMDGSEAQEQIEYWKRTLSGCTPFLALPYDRPRPAIQTYNGTVATVEISQELEEVLSVAAKQHHATVFMLYLGAFQILLFKYSGQREFCIGTAVAGRRWPETKDLIGMLVNNVALRASMEPRSTITSLIEGIRKTATGAYLHQDVPFDKVVQAVQLPRDLSYNPIFQAMLSFHDSPIECASLGTVTMEVEPGLSNGSAKFDLNIVLIPAQKHNLAENQKSRARILWEYNTDLFEQTTVLRMMQHFIGLLSEVAGNPEQQVSDLPFLTQQESRQILWEWNRTQLTVPRGKCIHHLFEEQATRTPHREALIYQNQRLTYAELDRKADQLSDYLHVLGVKTEVAVGVCLERSPELIIALLGIWKAGGVYVPLEPSYPQKRLQFMISDAACKVVLTQQWLAQRFSSQIIKVLALDREWQEITKDAGASQDGIIDPENSAYVIYTSGSSGTPKGVVVSHGAICNQLAWMQSEFPLDRERALYKTSISFDVSLEEILAPLVAGGTLVIARPGGEVDPDYLLKLMTDERVSLVDLPPLVLAEFLERLEMKDLSCLRWVFCGGEVVPLELAQRFQKISSAHMYNLYGPTETTIQVTFNPCSVRGGYRSVPIGKPIANVQVYVLDNEGQPAAVGVTGELYIGGAGLARGYLNSPELTAERFVPNAFGDGGGRLYRTGDLVRWHTDGRLEYLERSDQQVKVRGFRIEPGEIETALRELPSVQEAVVVLWQDTSGPKRLCAYVVPRDEMSPSPESLRANLQGQIPEYMMPAAFILVESLPLTANGKLDKKALPKPGSTTMLIPRTYQGPRTSTEEVLCGIWGKVLGLERVFVDDNFFNLGGDSIRSLRIVSLARRKKLVFSVVDLFQFPTVAGLARQLASRSQLQDGPSSLAQPFRLIPDDVRRAICGERQDIEDAYPAAYLQRGMIFHAELAPKSVVYHNINSVHLRMPWHLDALEQCLQRLFKRHAVLRTSFDLASQPEPLQLVHRNVEIPLAVDDLRHLEKSVQDEVIQKFMEVERRRRVDWKQAPLVRFQVHLRSSECWQLSISEHHAILDGWSCASLVAELLTEYRRLLHDLQAEPRPQLASSFCDFIALEQRAIQSAEAREYWKTKLHGVSMTELPRLPDYRGGETQAVNSKIAQDLGAETTRNLMALAKSLETPVKSILLAAHIRVISMVTAQADVLTGLVSHGRPELPDSEQILGLYLNMVPFCTNLTGGSWQELILQTFEVEREAFPFRHYPLAKIVEDLGGHKFFETSFNFVHFYDYDKALRESGIEVLDSTSIVDGDLTLMTSFVLGDEDISLVLSGAIKELGMQQLEILQRYYLAAIQAMITSPHSRYELWTLLSPQEWQQIVCDWNRTQLDFPIWSVSGLLEQHAMQRPHAIAVVCDQEQVSFGELNQRVNQLAHYLRRHGVSPEARVGICLERSTELAIALLAVIKAGGVYVPLSPLDPIERLSYMMADADLRILLTKERLCLALPKCSGQVVCLDGDARRIEQEQTHDPHIEVDPENAVYVVYTSGSTGKPKGVVGLHKGLLNRLQWMWERYPFRNGEVCCQKTSIGFVDSIAEMLGPLLAGVPLVVIPDEVVKDLAQFIAILRNQMVSRIVLVPSLLQVILDIVRVNEELWNVKLWVTSGEALPSETQRQFEAVLPESLLLNLYGVSEASADDTWAELSQHANSARPPIGRPLANAQIYVLDSWMHPVPVGTTGEIYIGGIALARGYWKRPELTAERFLPNPFAQEKGKRIYRTGDLGRYRPDGELEYEGRSDRQVKVRGHRIELDEVEAILRQVEGVRNVAVVTHEFRGEIRLVAYVAAENMEARQLEQASQARMPSYMAPSAFLVIKELPLMPSGKVDRKRLPRMEEFQLETDREHVTALSPHEQLLAGVWTAVLQVPRVRLSDSFFSLGGNSLLAMRVLARVREVFQVEMPLASLFDYPTLGEFAAALGAFLGRKHGQEIQPLERLDRNGELPASINQVGRLFRECLAGLNSAPLPPFHLAWTYQIEGKLNVVTLEDAINAWVQRHEVLRTSFPVKSDQERLDFMLSAQKAFQSGDIQRLLFMSSMFFQQRLHGSAPLKLSVKDLEGMEEYEQRKEIERQTASTVEKPFNYEMPPLLRATLLRLRPEQHLLVFAMHHLISDRWSIHVLLRELRALYAERSGNASCSLAVPQFQYADFASWQKDRLQGETLDRLLSYWRVRWREFPPTKMGELPFAQRGATVLSDKTETETFSFGPVRSRMIREFAQQHNLTLYMLFLGTLKILLHLYTGKPRIAVLSNFANRSRVETEQIVGWLANTHLLGSEVGAAMKATDFLKHVRAVVLEADAHQDLPFPLVWAALQQDQAGRSDSRRAEEPGDILFDLLTRAKDQEAIPGCDLKIKPFPQARETTDLGLSLVVIDDESEIILNSLYLPAKLPSWGMRQFLNDFQVVVANIVDRPHEAISTLSALLNATALSTKAI